MKVARLVLLMIESAKHVCPNAIQFADAQAEHTGAAYPTSISSLNTVDMLQRFYSSILAATALLQQGQEEQRDLKGGGKLIRLQGRDKKLLNDFFEINYLRPRGCKVYGAGELYPWDPLGGARGR